MSFADNLVYLRQHYGITQEGLAEQLSVSRQTVSKWKAGTNYPEMDKLLQLCDLFHTSLDDLMRGSVHVVKENDTERYDEHMNRFDLSIAAGVACILVGVGLNALLEAFGWPDNLQTVALLSCIVIGVVILIDVIMLIGLVPDNSSSMINGAYVEELVMFPFMLILAIAIGILIWACMQKSKYDLSELTYIAHRRNLGADMPSTAVVKSPEQIRAERVMGVICGCIMLLATIVFLVWGFVPLFDQIGGWDGIDKFALKDAIRRGAGGFAISWIAFVVGGILCGIVWMIGSVVSKTQEDWIAEARQEDAWVKYAQQDDPWSRGPEDPASSQTPTPSSAPREANDPAGRTWKH